MKTKLLVSIPLTLSLILLAFTPTNKLELGSTAPMQDYKMEDVSGKSFSLKELKGENGLVVIFSCNTCPFVLAWENEYNIINEVGAREKINVVLVNSNAAKRSGDDSMEEMIKHAKKENYQMNYVLDKKNELANAFGANTTPHVFLFNKDMKLVYTGLINDLYDQQDRQAKKHFLQDAMIATGENKTIPVTQTPNRGCSIKKV